MSEPLEIIEPDPLMEVCRQCGTSLDVTALEPLTDIICPNCNSTSQARVCLKNYKIVGVLGSGGMGSVFRARDLTLNREVALKVIKREFSNDPKHSEKFEAEARSTALVNHPNVVKVFSSGADHGLLYIAMELAENGSLDDLMTAHKKIPEEQALEIGIQITEGLRAAHKRGLIHRDIKPGNILFMEDQTAKIVDFGLACLVAEANAPQGEIWGTPAYVAPEKLNQDPEDFRSDIYSLGGTLFHAIAGRPPHEAETASIAALKKIKATTVKIQKLAPEISDASALVINRMLQHDPAERYQTYAELVEDLIKARLALTAGTPTKQTQVKKRIPSGVILWSVWFVVVCSGLISILYAGKQMRKEKAAAKISASTLKVQIKEATPIRNISEEYKQARKLLVEGNYEKAGRSFTELATLPNLQQPLGRWIILHQGMIALLDGKQTVAKPIFQRLHEIGGFSLEPADKILVDLFVESGHLLAGDAVIQANKILADEGCEVITLFLYALHDWRLGQFDEADLLFKRFLDSNPTDPFVWIADYKPIAKKYGDDFASYKKIMRKVSNATTLQLKNEALTELQGMKSPPLLPGALPEKLKQLQEKLQQTVDAEKSAEEQKRLAEKAAEDQKHAAELEKQKQLLTDLKLKTSKLQEEFRFDEALTLIQATQVTLKELEPDKMVLLKKAQWLQSFIATLVGDLAAGEDYPQPIVKRSGAAVAVGLVKATKMQIEIQTQYGKLAVSWFEISPATILAMADYFGSKKARPETIADRWWNAGVFAYQTGLQKQGLFLLSHAADRKPEYKEFLPLFSTP